jgi:hypothetical protein
VNAQLPGRITELSTGLTQVKMKNLRAPHLGQYQGNSKVLPVSSKIGVRGKAKASRWRSRGGRGSKGSVGVRGVGGDGPMDGGRLGLVSGLTLTSPFILAW